MPARALILACTIALFGASPMPGKMPAPTVPLHAVFTVATNKLGQVVRVVSAQASKDERFNTITRGNAMQAFIRRPDGTAVAGVYKLTYDYSPATKDVRRDVRLVHAGGVDPNAKGAVTAEMERNAKSHPASTPDPLREAKKATTAGSNSHLPDFSHIVSGSDK
ncbi:MAG: hypothetical protein ACREML_11385 [Vulcanimicrobiaceae bacterium]